jgi:hypothetical protein
MSAFRQICEDAPEFIPIPKSMQHHRVEVVLLPLNEMSSPQPIRKRKPPTHFAGRVKELGDVIRAIALSRHLAIDRSWSIK